ncbi:MAG: glycerol-3-phosphate dehydrogenase [Sphingomonas sp.]|nr:glycerol-3-phosphate dehydrogenase [Sphingomonas sp.]
MSDAEFDLLVVGGGINGVGIARDAAGRGLSVLLVEKDDLAAHTSSASSKLVHGGLRYLEHYDLKLVRESLVERERLLRAAPHIVRPLEFVLPLSHSPRPAWLIRAGLILYDHLGRRKLLPSSRVIRLDRDPAGQGLRPSKPKAFAYWDCTVQDSRLVVLNAIDAAERGAKIETRTELTAARRQGGHWIADLRGRNGDWTVTAKVLVNAAGPWVSSLLDRLSGVKRRHPVRLVKGSHIVLPRLYPGDHAFLLQTPEGRVVFAIPFERDLTLVGTTDVDWDGPPPDRPAASDAELDYLLAIVRRTFTASVSSDDIVWSYSGVRALLDDGASDPSKVTRDYCLDLDTSEGAATLLNIIGGKITTYRRLAEKAVGQLAPFLPGSGAAWTDGALLPGGDIPDSDPEAYGCVLAKAYASLPPELLCRLASSYGTRAVRLLSGGLGEDLGSGLFASEVDYLVENEWARTAEDVLFRRTKLGLRASRQDVTRLEAYLSSRASADGRGRS